MTPRTGFTLIELSIVLVIVGLVIGGIFVGNSLIRASQINAIIKQESQYVSAVNTFRSKYGGLPGDLKNAIDFWGNRGGNASDNYTDSCIGASPGAPQPLTCNGYNNGRICGGGYNYWDFMCEDGLLVWQHLANAGLISGAYAGYYNMDWAQIGFNTPASRISPTQGFMMYYVCMTGNTGSMFFPNMPCGNTLFYGTQAPLPGSQNWTDYSLYPALTALEAMNLDSKIDDGKPGTGSVISMAGGSPDFGTANCASSGVPATATYNASTTTGPQCSLLFVAAF